MLYNLKLIFAFLTILFFASGCGGGGGGSGGSSSPTSAANWTSSCSGAAQNSDGVVVPCAQTSFTLTENSTKGTYVASDYEAQDFGGWTGTFSAVETTSNGYYEGCFNDYGSSTWNDNQSCGTGWQAASGNGQQYVYSGVTETAPDATVSFSAFTPILHMTDTGATTAWSQGWTGTGTTINIIDDASWDDINVDLGYYSVGRDLTSGDGTTQNQYTSTHSVVYSDDMTVSHGWIVKHLAGGDKASQNDYVINTEYHSYTISDCKKVKNVIRPSGYDGTNVGQNGVNTVENVDVSYTTESDKNTYCSYSWTAPTWSDTPLVMSPGVAKDATMTASNVNLSPYQTPGAAWAYINGFLENSGSFDAVNLSLGLSINSDFYDWDYMKNNKLTYDFGTSPNGVFVIAAGNSSAPCTETYFRNCNLLAAIMLLNDQLRDQTIVVGATDTVSGIKTIATYSNQAGVMKDRYLMANGDSGWNLETSTNTGDDVEGTSFAAPRIAGAAAIVKSKFPNLSGANVADILLLTADKDINDDGFDDFSSTSSVYGRGELDLSSALSPVGNLTP